MTHHNYEIVPPSVSGASGYRVMLAGTFTYLSEHPTEAAAMAAVASYVADPENK